MRLFRRTTSGTVRLYTFCLFDKPLVASMTKSHQILSEQRSKRTTGLKVSNHWFTSRAQKEPLIQVHEQFRIS